MLKLENIDKLIGTSILNWECVNVSDALGTYLITFKPRGNSIFTVEFLLNREDSHLRGIYKVDGMLYESSGFSNVLIGNFDMHVTRTELQTPMEFIRVLTQPLRVFEKDMEVNIQMLQEELGDLLAMIDLLVKKDVGVDWKELMLAKQNKFLKLKQWSNIEIE